MPPPLRPLSQPASQHRTIVGRRSQEAVRDVRPSAKEKLGLWIDVTVCAAHTATARAQMGAGCCLGPSLEERAHTSAYMSLSSRMASLLATASQKILSVPHWVGTQKEGGPHFSPVSPAPERPPVTRRQVTQARLSLLLTRVPQPMHRRAGHGPEPPCSRSYLSPILPFPFLTCGHFSLGGPPL